MGYPSVSQVQNLHGYDNFLNIIYFNLWIIKVVSDIDSIENESTYVYQITLAYVSCYENYCISNITLATESAVATLKKTSIVSIKNQQV